MPQSTIDQAILEDSTQWSNLERLSSLKENDNSVDQKLAYKESSLELIKK